MALFQKNDILLDDKALIDASSNINEVVKDMKSIQKSIDNMLKELHTGFQTPAGDKFIQACEKDLLKPMKTEISIMEKISENLKIANTQYQRVFEEFKNLNKLIK